MAEARRPLFSISVRLDLREGIEINRTIEADTLEQLANSAKSAAGEILMELILDHPDRIIIDGDDSPIRVKPFFVYTDSRMLTRDEGVLQSMGSGSNIDFLANVPSVILSTVELMIRLAGPAAEFRDPHHMARTLYFVELYDFTKPLIGQLYEDRAIHGKIIRETVSMADYLEWGDVYRIHQRRMSELAQDTRRRMRVEREKWAAKQAKAEAREAKKQNTAAASRAGFWSKLTGRK